MTPPQNSDRIALLLDVGNTRIKAGWCGLDRPTRESALLAVGHDEHDALFAWLRTQPGMVTDIVGTNVAGAALASKLACTLSKAGYPPVQWIDGQHAARGLGVINGYDNPRQLGADRWVAMLGLAEIGVRPQLLNGVRPRLLASFGTATTVDVLCPVASPEAAPHAWKFVGGLILPGVALMREALATQTADLPAAHGEVVDFPRETHQAIISGVAAAQAGAVLRQWQTTQRLFGMPPDVFCTGGSWPAVAHELNSQLLDTCQQRGLPAQPAHWLAAPVLDGLARLARA